MSGSLLSAQQQQKEQESADVSDRIEDTPDQRPKGYVAPKLPLHVSLDYILRPWRDRPANSLTYVPFWTDPSWDRRMQISMSGRQEKRLYSDEPTISRPAVLPRDEARFPTPYARYDNSWNGCCVNPEQS